MYKSLQVFKAAEDCYGGVARLVTAVKELRASDPNVIFLNGGDFYQGNVWYTYFKWRVVAHFGNILNFTAMVSENIFFSSVMALNKESSN